MKTILLISILCFSQNVFAQVNYLQSMSEASEKSAMVDSLASIGKLKEADQILGELLSSNKAYKENYEMQASILWSIAIQLGDKESENHKKASKYYCQKFLNLVSNNFNPEDVAFYDYHLRAMRMYNRQIPDKQKVDSLYQVIEKNLPIYFRDCKYTNHLRSITQFAELKKDFKLCEKLYEKDIACQAEEHGKDYGTYAESVAFYASFQERRGKKKKADKLYQEFIRSYRAFFQNKGQDITESFMQVAGFYIQTQRFEIVNLLLNEVEKDLKAKADFSEEHENYLSLLSTRAKVHYFQNELDKSVAIFEKMISILENDKDEKGYDMKEACLTLNYLYKTNNQKEKAKELRDKYPNFFKE